ncbi:Fe-S oxidoreductase, partial [Saccharopolyspora sp. HNM0986]|nr:Fe-S oxidoreductase [Saccharopolyspora sp. HNM0986]
DRVDEALGTAPQKIATGCPFCRVMLTDGLTSRQNEQAASEDVEVLDVAQLLLSSVKRGTDGASAPVTETDPGAEAEANGKADVATDAEPTGTPLPKEDKADS